EAITVDGTGNVYVAGEYFSAVCLFDNFSQTNAGVFSDIFIAKCDTDGNVLWVKRAGGTSADYATGIATDTAGNVYVTGYFLSSTATFGTVTLTNASPGSYDL